MTTSITWAKKAYSITAAQTWNTVDMVLELYRGAILSIQQAIQAEGQGRPDQAQELRLKAVRLVHGIVAGLDFSQGEIPANCARLCEFVQHCLLDKDRQRDAAALQVLSTLCEAFEAIRDQVTPAS